MTNIIIIHGTGGSPEGNWFPWLKKELEALGHTVYVPLFPTPENQSLENWLEVFKDYEGYLDENSIVVGHSLGPAFLLSIIEKLNQPIKAAFFIAGFTGLIDLPDIDKLNKTFTLQSFDWNKIKENSKKFTVINSDDDPYVKLDKGKELAQKLDTELIILHNAGHINKDSGYVTFDFLLDKIKGEL